MKKLKIYYPPPHGKGPTGTEDPEGNAQCWDCIEAIEAAFGKAELSFKRDHLWPNGVLYYRMETELSLDEVRAVLLPLLGDGYEVQLSDGELGW